MSHSCLHFFFSISTSGARKNLFILSIEKDLQDKRASMEDAEAMASVTWVKVAAPHLSVLCNFNAGGHVVSCRLSTPSRLIHRY